MSIHLAHGFLLFATIPGLQGLWLLKYSTKELWRFVNVLWHFWARIWWKQIKQRECETMSFEKKRGTVQRVWGTFRLAGLKLIITSSRQLRARCTFAYSAKERCILVIWNCVHFPEVSLNYLHLIQYDFFIRHLPESRVLQCNGNTVEGLLPSEFTAHQKGSAATLHPCARAGLFLRCPAKIAHLWI